MAKRVIITASGGGHTGYAVALAQSLDKKAEMLFIVPENDKWTRSKVEKYGKVIYVRKARGPKDHLAKAIPGLIKAGLQSLEEVKGDFDVFVSTGSNHSVPPAIAAKMKGLRLINIESSVRFTKASLSVRALRYIADLTILQWPEQKKILPEGIVVGPLFEKPLYQCEDKGYILVTGGTYGHKLLFDTINNLSLDNIVLQTGRINPDPYRKKHPQWIVFDFDPDFQKWIASANIVISHLGKTVIDAALTYKKPTIIVPNPEWTLTAGWPDGEILAKKLNAFLVSKITPKNILKAIEEVKNRRPPLFPDGAKRLAKIILSKI
ncbi:MAG: UDP-N-acetylglucosamine--N-acetylmuramyl-(pentapeptide) pyrophosphoryl-undecaprenol N-acetylglucosamine transferase [Candidatus Odinarchaeia archaeon]